MTLIPPPIVATDCRKLLVAFMLALTVWANEPIMPAKGPATSIADPWNRLPIQYWKFSPVLCP